MHTLKAMILLLSLTMCNSRNMSRNDAKIIGGRFALKGEFPYVVAFSGRYICSGALISLRQIMTSARCFFDKHKVLIKFWSKIDVVAGSLEIPAVMTKPTDPDAQVRRLSSVSFARGFNDKSMEGIVHHDLAFARVSKPFERSNTLALATLPGRSGDEVECKWHELAKAGNLKCHVMGWGTTKLLDGAHATQHSQFLKVSEVKAWTDCKCQKEVTLNDVDGTLHGEVCLEPVNKDDHTCEGDQGAPIVCEGLIFGVVSTTMCYVEAEYSDHRRRMDKQYGILMWNYFDNVDLPSPIKSNSFRLHFNVLCLVISSLFF